MAASGIAPMPTSTLMVQMDKRYPGYGFASHKGYSTPEHLEALNRLGPCRIHRKGFAPVFKAMNPDLFDAPRNLPDAAPV